MVASIRNSEVRGEPWGALDRLDNYVTVEDLPLGAEGDLGEWLDGLVGSAHEEAQRAIQRTEPERALETADREKRARDAAESQRRFREME